RLRRVGAADYGEIGFRHFTRIGAIERARPREPAGPGEGGADRGILPRIFLRMTEAVDAVALHKSHRSGVIIGPDGFTAVAGFALEEGFGNLIKRIIPADLLPASAALLAGPPHWMHQTVGMMDAFGIAGDLGADDAGSIGIVGGAPDAADTKRVKSFHLQRAG